MTYYDDRPGSTYVNLGDEGLQDGDHISSWLDTYFDSGNQVFIPEGEYYYDGSGIGGTRSDAALIGDPNGVIFHRPSDPENTVRPAFDTGSGDHVVENITIKGVKGQAQSRWAANTQGGGDLTFRNINFPDGTTECSDSECWLIGLYSSDALYGNVYIDRCYIGPHGNSPIYATYADGSPGEVHVSRCTFENSNEMIRLGPDNSSVTDCRVIGDGNVPTFGEEGNCGGAYLRFLKIENYTTGLEVDGCDFYLSSACESPGPFFDDQDTTNGTISNCRIYNETSAWLVRDGSGMSASNIHVSGPGDTTIPWPDSGDDMPSNEKVVWTPAQEGGGAGEDVGGVSAASAQTLASTESVTEVEQSSDQLGAQHLGLFRLADTYSPGNTEQGVSVLTSSAVSALTGTETVEQAPQDDGPTPTTPIEAMPYHWDVEYQTDGDGTYLVRPGTTVIEDFEAGNMDNYWVRDTGATQIQQNTVQSGSYALAMPPGDGGTDVAFSADGGGLSYYPRRGDTFRTWFRKEGSTTFAIQFAVQRSSQDGYNYWEPCYSLWMGETSNSQRLNLVKYETDGTSTRLAADTYSAMFGQWNYVDIDFGEDNAGTITVTVYDGSTDNSVLTIHGSDSEYDGGGVTWVASANMAYAVYIDRCYVTETRL